eukprot:jgi/Mesvir1/16233/Mv08486-RA.2
MGRAWQTQAVNGLSPIHHLSSNTSSEGKTYAEDGDEDATRKVQPVNRFVVVKTRIFLLFMISAAVIISAIVTWNLSLRTTNDAFDEMSDILRNETVGSSASKVTDVLNSLSLGSFSVFKCLETLPAFTDEVLASTALTCMWGTAAGDGSARVVYVLTPDDTMCMYRRWGPEAQMLNASIIVAIPAPLDDPSALVYVYLPDNVTGRPLLDGPMVKICTQGRCPPGPDASLYSPVPMPPVKELPAWSLGQQLAHGESRLWASMGIGGNWQPTINVVKSLRAPASGNLTAVTVVAYQASVLKEFLSQLLVVSSMGGVIFITAGERLDLISSTHGALAAPVVADEGTERTFLSAFDSDFDEIRIGSRRMNATFGAALQTHACEIITDLHRGGSHFVTSQPLEYGGLTLVTFLIVPVGALRGNIDASRNRSLWLSVIAVTCIFIIGVVGIFLSTMLMSRTYKLVAEQNQMLLEKLQQPAGANGNDWPQVDMGTAAEKLHAMIKSLRGGRVITASQVAAMQELIATDDMHKPQFLRNMQEAPSVAAEMDRETGTWLASLTDPGAPNRRKPSRRSSISGAKSLKSLQTMRSSDYSAYDDFMSAQGLVAMQPGNNLQNVMDVTSEDDEEVTRHLADLDTATQLLAPRRPRQSLEDYEARKKALYAAVLDPAPAALPQETMKSLSQELLAQLEKIGSWELDTLALSQASAGRPILFVGYLSLASSGLVKEFRLPKDKLVRFLLGLEQGMDPEALYHSAAHIADVTGCLFHLLTESGVSKHLRRIDQLAAICAALVHDYKHPGVSNDFIQKMGGELAMRYNDRSALENFHLSEAFSLLTNKECHFLKHMGTMAYAEIRHIMIEMVLATDLKRHFALLDKFKTRLLTLSEKPWDSESESDRLLLLRMAIKVSDLGHTCKALPLHQQWTALIVEEFYTQGDAERAAQVDISPFMDRTNNCVPKAQVGVAVSPYCCCCK